MENPNFKDILEKAAHELTQMNGSNINVLTLAKPLDFDTAIESMKVLSKASPLIANKIEMESIKILNSVNWKVDGKWIRQDPNFPDLLFDSKMDPKPGIEIKTWFPLATEITARFKESMSHFNKDQTKIAVFVWLPDKVFYGTPKIIGIWIGSAKSFALARDKHYNNPPDYIVLEPEDTSKRTGNLQQTNTNGYKFQGNKKQLLSAEKEVKAWGPKPKEYRIDKEYQNKLRILQNRYPYRLDTNFAKIDRIEHEELETFKTKIQNTKIMDKTISEWAKLIEKSHPEIKSLFDNSD